MLWALLAAIPAPATAAQSPFAPVKVQSCLLADSLLGPIAEDRGAVVRANYLPTMDSTRLVAGPERSTMYEEQSRPMIDVMTSYGGHQTTSYPHADISFLMIRHEASTLASSPGSAPVVLIIDESPFQLDSVPIKPSPSPVGQSVFITLQLAPNFFFALATAKQATFRIGKVRAAFSPRDLQNIRGLYRVALCGLPDVK